LIQYLLVYILGLVIRNWRCSYWKKKKLSRKKSYNRKPSKSKNKKKKRKSTLYI